MGKEIGQNRVFVLKYDLQFNLIMKIEKLVGGSMQRKSFWNSRIGADGRIYELIRFNSNMHIIAYDPSDDEFTASSIFIKFRAQMLPDATNSSQAYFIGRILTSTGSNTGGA